ncbi:hypothetical protein LCER1_G002254 [Lachnellula cervina]|uniref:Uncharacterized protein n=1 Tax=Lachnellula cervina TaxID=1316786 RepID=A0A7D8US35_9HELO|nr:hypothetical protein LCER1_G002254 [Lachnellula cervina]
MASRLLTPTLRSTRAISTCTPSLALRSFHSSPASLAEAATPLPIKKPYGAFKSGFFGFFLGSTLAGVGTYYYVLEEYKVSNELLTEDIYRLQASVQRTHTYVQGLEEKFDELQRERKKK